MAVLPFVHISQTGFFVEETLKIDCRAAGSILDGGSRDSVFLTTDI
jgi:hypothetical protein